MEDVHRLVYSSDANEISGYLEELAALDPESPAIVESTDERRVSLQEERSTITAARTIEVLQVRHGLK